MSQRGRAGRAVDAATWEKQGPGRAGLDADIAASAWSPGGDLLEGSILPGKEGAPQLLALRSSAGHGSALPVPDAPGWPGVGPGPGQAGASAKPAPEREHGCHLPTTPSPLQTPSPKDAFWMLWPLWLLRGLPGWHRALAHPWDSSGGPCPGTAPCQPSPRSSVSLARAAGALSGLRQGRGTGPVVQDGRDCREDSWSLSQDLAQRSETRSVPMRGCLPFQSLLPAL